MNKNFIKSLILVTALFEYHFLQGMEEKTYKLEKTPESSDVKVFREQIEESSKRFEEAIEKRKESDARKTLIEKNIKDLESELSRVSDESRRKDITERIQILKGLSNPQSDFPQAKVKSLQPGLLSIKVAPLTEAPPPLPPRPVRVGTGDVTQSQSKTIEQIDAEIASVKAAAGRTMKQIQTIESELQPKSKTIESELQPKSKSELYNLSIQEQIAAMRSGKSGEEIKKLEEQFRRLYKEKQIEELEAKLAKTTDTTESNKIKEELQLLRELINPRVTTSIPPAKLRPFTQSDLIRIEQAKAGSTKTIESELQPKSKTIESELQPKSKSPDTAGEKLSSTKSQPGKYAVVSTERESALRSELESYRDQDFYEKLKSVDESSKSLISKSGLSAEQRTTLIAEQNDKSMILQIKREKDDAQVKSLRSEIESTKKSIENIERSRRQKLERGKLKKINEDLATEKNILKNHQKALKEAENESKKTAKLMEEHRKNMIKLRNKSEKENKSFDKTIQKVDVQLKKIEESINQAGESDTTKLEEKKRNLSKKKKELEERKTANERIIKGANDFFMYIVPSKY